MTDTYDRRNGTATDVRDPSLVVSEVFGPTLQGEGRNLGRRAAFVRLGGCNLHCIWCDTPYTWDASRFDLRAELTRRPVHELLDQVEAMRPDVVVLTGGEPLMHQAQHGWGPLLAGLDWFAVEVETNGTIAPNPESLGGIGLFNVSPKLAHNGDPVHRRIVPHALAAFAALAHHDRAVLKVVCQTPEDVAQTAALAQEYGWPRRSVYVMAEGTTPEQILTRQQQLVDAVLEHRVGMTTRLHTLVWGQERAR